MQSAVPTARVQLNVFDRIVCGIFPGWGMSRVRNRSALQYLGDQGFITPGSSNRAMRAWNPTANSADADSIYKLDAMRAGSRDLSMNTPLVRAALGRCKYNVIGSGLLMQSRIDREILNLDNKKATEWERNTEREFSLWASSCECDAARTLNFYDLTSLAFYSILLSGDVFVAFPWIPRKGQAYDLRIKLIEADYVSNPQFSLDTPKLAGGVEIDENGAPVKYYFRRPASMTSLDFGPSVADVWTPIDVYGPNGMRQVLHLFDKERPGQRRGIPMIAPLTEQIKQIARYSKAEIDAAIINSFFTVFVKHSSQEGKLMNGYVPPTSGLPLGASDVKQTPDSYPADEVVYEMGSGNTIDMGKDEDISIADPKHPTSGYEQFVAAVTKQIGAALNIPHEVLTLHFQSSYSAARASLNEAWKFFMARRTLMSRYFCQPAYEWWITEAILKGRISAPGFFADPVVRMAWLGTAWVGPGRGMIDPKKEIDASKASIDARLSTYEDEYVKLNGGDWESAMDRLSREKELLKEKDLEAEETEPAPTRQATPEELEELENRENENARTKT